MAAQGIISKHREPARFQLRRYFREDYNANVLEGLAGKPAQGRWWC
jgi:hypothetical protein